MKPNKSVRELSHVNMRQLTKHEDFIQNDRKPVKVAMISRLDLIDAEIISVQNGKRVFLASDNEALRGSLIRGRSLDTQRPVRQKFTYFLSSRGKMQDPFIKKVYLIELGFSDNKGQNLTYNISTNSYE